MVFWVRIQLGSKEYLGVLETGVTISIVGHSSHPCRAAGVVRHAMPLCSGLEVPV